MLAAFAAGLLTFASPCVLPLAPVYLGLLAGSSERTGGSRRGPVFAAIGFALGLSTVFVALGLAASSAASVLSEHRQTLLWVGGAVLILFGAKLLGILRIPFLNREVRPLFQRVPRAAGPVGGFFLGAAFGLGWTPCVGPVLGAVLTYAASASHSPAEAAAYLCAYALGLSLPLVASSFAAPLATRALAKIKRFTPMIERGTGVLLVAAGVLLATDRLDVMAPTVASKEAVVDPTPITAVGEGEELMCTRESGCEAEVGAEHGAEPTAPALLSSHGEPELIVFTSPSCETCARMRSVIAESEKRCDAAPGTVRAIDLAGDEGRALARRYAVRVVPTFLSVDAKGVEVARLVGEQDVKALTRALGDVRAERCAI